jgi:murein DD-endopeptidase MepM/ murein hydrolase activator NlpD
MEVENVNEKKLFQEKKTIRKGIVNFVEKKGFYIVLILCVAIIATTAVIISTHPISSPSTDFNAKIIPDNTQKAEGTGDAKNGFTQPAINTPISTIDNKTSVQTPTVKSQNPVQNVQPKQAKTTENANTSVNKNVKKENTKATTIEKFIMPVFGEISYGFSEDHLAFSETLDEWRTHSGVDITAARGTQVKVVADGVVSEIKNDPRYGISVLVDHQNGIKTLYSNLASDDVVAPNQEVKQGDVIGSIGNSATFEAAEQEHLHFEVWKDNEPVNPVSFLPQK